ncbi:hypothetical protein OROHE_007598 [Orobanche hederae]
MVDESLVDDNPLDSFVLDSSDFSDSSVDHSGLDSTTVDDTPVNVIILVLKDSDTVVPDSFPYITLVPESVKDLDSCPDDELVVPDSDDDVQLGDVNKAVVPNKCISEELDEPRFLVLKGVHHVTINIFDALLRPIRCGFQQLEYFLRVRKLCGNNLDNNLDNNILLDNNLDNNMSQEEAMWELESKMREK